MSKKGNLDFFLEVIKLDRDELHNVEARILEYAESLGYFDDPAMLKYNQQTAEVLASVAFQIPSSNLLLTMFNAFAKEIAIGLCLGLEWFTQLGDASEDYLLDGLPNGEKISARWQDQYAENFKTFYVFMPEHSDFMDNHFDDYYRNYLSNLYHYAGLEEVFIDRFFESDFQIMRMLLFEFAIASQTKDFSSLGNRLITVYSDGVIDAKVDIYSEADLNRYLDDRPELYYSLITVFLNHMDCLRKCTFSIAGTFMEAVYHNPAAKLKGNPTVELNSFELLKKMVREMIDDPAVEFEKRASKVLYSFVEDNAVALTRSGGFIAVASRQQSLFSGLNAQDALVFQVRDEEEAERVVGERNQVLDDLASLHRLCFLLEHRKLFTGNEQVLLIEKLVTILTSASSNYFADIFELYFAVLLKKSGVEVSLLISQRHKGQEVSTCDYKFGAVAAADCKCIIGHDAKLRQVSHWCQKVAKQVNSTIGYQGVEFGGAVIACRDRDFGFLRAFQNYKGVDKFDLVERSLLMQVLMEIYAEFRRHGGKQQEHIKFIVFYYLPTLSISVEDAVKLKPDSTTTRKEMLAVMTTRYASDEQVDQIAEIFRPACNFIFKFNNGF